MKTAAELSSPPPIRPIRNEDDYRAAVAQIEGLMVPFRELGRDEADRLAVLSELASAYDERRFLREPLPLHEALGIRLQKTGRNAADLAADLRSVPLATALLRGSEVPDVPTALLLRERYNIPLEISLNASAPSRAA